MAAARGASIQRVFVISIEEIGIFWATTLTKNLEKLNVDQKDPGIDNLIASLRYNIGLYKGVKESGLVDDIPENLLIDPRKQLIQVIKAHYNANKGIIRNYN